MVFTLIRHQEDTKVLAFQAYIFYFLLVVFRQGLRYCQTSKRYIHIIRLQRSRSYPRLCCQTVCRVRQAWPYGYYRIVLKR
jgi:hypothetical protein